MLMVGTISPRKNQLRLIKAFELVHRNNPNNDARTDNRRSIAKRDSRI